MSAIPHKKIIAGEGGVKYGRPLGNPKIIQKVEVTCTFGAQKSSIPFYVGDPQAEKHPIAHQTHWLSSERGGTVPEEFLNTLSTIQHIAQQNGLSCAEVCGYTLNSLNPVAETRLLADYSEEDKTRILEQLASEHPELSEEELLQLLQQYVANKSKKPEAEKGVQK